MLLRAIGVVLLLVTAVANAEAASVTVWLDRNGELAEDGVEIPAFGGGNRVWNAVVACVREQYAPFDVDIVEGQPARGHYITAVIGGRASMMGMDDAMTNGVGGYDSTVLRDQVVHVFSQVGSGERNVENLCAVTAHEVGHALGLDHEYYCGDIMSYFVDQCGARKFVDVDAACGEAGERTCGSGEEAQNSYRRLGQLVGFRPRQQPVAEQEPQDDSWVQREGEWQADDNTPQDPYIGSQEPYIAPEDPYANEPPPVAAHSCDRAPSPEHWVKLSRRDVANWRASRHVAKPRHVASSRRRRR